MYELSDKTYKCSTDTEEPLDDSGNQNYDQKSSSVTSIHGCIAVMKQLVLPLFNKFMDDFFLHTFHPEGLQGNQLNQSATSQQSQQQFPLFTVSEKTQTLNRQLQELLSWSSICGQPRSGETYAANTVRFQLNQNAKRSTAGEVDGDVSSMSDSSSTVSSVTEANKKSGTDDGINEVNTSQVEDSRTAKLSALKLPIANISHQGDSYSAPVSARMIPAEELDLNIRAILAEVSSSSNVNSALNSATVETASMKLYHCLQSNLSEYITVNLCGSSALGLTEFDLKKVELDFAALVDPGENNFHSLTLQQKRMAMQQHLQLKLELRKLENIVEHQGIVESALKHVKACMKDLASTSTNFFVRLQSSVDKMLSNPEEHVMKHAEYYFLQRQQLTSPRVQTPRGASYASPRENFADGGGYTSRTSTGFEGGCPPGALNMDRNYWMRLLLAIKEDIELLRSSHDAAVDFYSLYCNGYSQSLNSTAVVQRYDAVREAIEAADNEKSQSIRKALKACEKLFKDAGFLNVRTVLNKTRFLHLKYSIPLENLRDVVQCSLFMSNLLPIQSTDLIHAYISLDKTGKVKDYLRIIRLFVKYHQICDATYGYLTTYAWMVMALHVLLRFELIPNIHSNFIYRCDNDSQWRLFYGELDLTKPYYLDGSSRDPSIEDENAPHNLLPNSARPKLDSDAVQYSDMPRSSYADTFLSTRVTDPQFQLPESYRDRLANTGLFEMLDLFFRYYVEQFDVYRSIVSLKGQGEVGI